MLNSLDAVERLYDAHIAACRERIRGFPPELQREKLHFWQDLRKAHLHYLAAEES